MTLSSGGFSKGWGCSESASASWERFPAVERQRVAIARALAQEPRILVLDEPTNHLDIRHQLETLALLRELGLTVVCSLHDLNAAIDFADLVLVLFGGEILEFGTPSDVLTPETISVAFSVNATGGEPNGRGARQFQFWL